MPTSAYWDSVASSCRGSSCSFTPSVTLCHTRRGELRRSCCRADIDNDAGEAEEVLPLQSRRQKYRSLRYRLQQQCHSCFISIYSIPFLYSQLFLSIVLWHYCKSTHPGTQSKTGCSTVLKILCKDPSDTEIETNLRQTGAQYRQLDSPKVWQKTFNFWSQYW